MRHKGEGALHIKAYHGTTLKVAKAIEAKETNFYTDVENGGDWLGTGAYFFQDAPQRALDWAARFRCTEPDDDPAVIVADVSLENCLDLLEIEGFRRVADYFPDFLAAERASLSPRPQPGLLVVGGKAKIALGRQRALAAGLTKGRPTNFRDRALIDFCAKIERDKGQEIKSVRGAFLWGSTIFPESFLFDQSHVEIAVRDASMIENPKLHSFAKRKPPAANV